MKKQVKKKYTGVFRDGGAGRLATERLRKRRQRLMARENRLMVLTGVPYGPGQETGWAYTYSPTYQEPAIMYLTGINQEQVILLLDPHSRESREILFVGKKNTDKEFWDGYRFGVGDPRSVGEVRKVTGIRDVRDIADFKDVLKERFKKQKPKSLGTLWLEGRIDGKRKIFKSGHNWDFKRRLEGWLRSWKAPGNALHNIMDNHFDLRLPLDAFDVASCKRAHQLTAEAFKATLAGFHRFRREYEVGGFLEGQMLMRTPYGLSFPSIIASGSNATILHYLKNDDEIGTGELVLMDFGARWMTMHADISRTVPASGKFNPLQKRLYEYVLKAQKDVEKAARAGVTIQSLNDLCWDSINHSLEKDFRKAGGKFKLKYEKKPHGVSHLMGEQEHDGDPFRIYMGYPMKEGWVISNEPGLYGTFRWKHEGRIYDEEIGIRIEDNLLITRGGCVNLAKPMPKSVAEIERLMARGKKSRG